ncbi:hypothetical protein BDV96DRAFT_601891 [Lophiotrema nucula]|uniref:Uncharacterized protein n=1 Tax=Lophiotrema nucula TaxID=690887 RepID=A0A6A5Z244_9PLEO|nr:hypothetical protein BDV96DRAFT_601891 [Lophiotrema nucula]
MNKNTQYNQPRSPQHHLGYGQGYGHDGQQGGNRGQTPQRGRGGYYRKNTNGYRNKGFTNINDHGQGHGYNNFDHFRNGGQYPNPQNFTASPSHLSVNASPFVPTNRITPQAAAASAVPFNVQYQQAVNASAPPNIEATTVPAPPETVVKVMQQPAVVNLPKIETPKPTSPSKQADAVILQLEQDASTAPTHGVIPFPPFVDAVSSTRGTATMPNSPVRRPASVSEKFRPAPVVNEHVKNDFTFDLIEHMTKHLPQEKRDSFQKRVANILSDLSQFQAVLHQKRSGHNSTYLNNYHDERYYSHEQARHQDQVTHCYSLVVRSSGDEKKWHEENVLKHMLKVQKYQKAVLERQDKVEEARLALKDIDQALTDLLAKTQACLIDVFLEVENYKIGEPEQPREEKDVAVEADLPFDTAPPQTVESSTMYMEKANVLDKLEKAVADAAKKTDNTEALKKLEFDEKQAEGAQATFTPSQQGDFQADGDDPFKHVTEPSTVNNKETNESAIVSEAGSATGVNTASKHEVKFIAEDATECKHEAKSAAQDATNANGECVQTKETSVNHNTDAGHIISQPGTFKKKPKKKSKNKNKNKGAETQEEQTGTTNAGNNTAGNTAGKPQPTSVTGSNRSSRPPSALGTTTTHGRKHSKDTKPGQRTASRSSRPSSALGYNTMQENGKTVKENEEAARARSARRASNAHHVGQDASAMNQDRGHARKPSVTAGAKPLNAFNVAAETKHTRKPSHNRGGGGGSKTTIVEEKNWTGGKKMIVTENRASGAREATVVPKPTQSTISKTGMEHERKTSSSKLVESKHERKPSSLSAAEAKMVLQEKPNSTHEVKNPSSASSTGDVMKAKHEKNKKSFDNKPATPEKQLPNTAQAEEQGPGEKNLQSPSSQKTWAQHLGGGGKS